MENQFYNLSKKGMILSVYIQPNSREDRIIGTFDNALKIKIASPPVDNKANEHLITFLAKILKISKSCIEIINGDTQRKKRILITSITEEIFKEKILSLIGTENGKKAI